VGFRGFELQLYIYYAMSLSTEINSTWMSFLFCLNVSLYLYYSNSRSLMGLHTLWLNSSDNSFALFLNPLNHLQFIQLTIKITAPYFSLLQSFPFSPHKFKSKPKILPANIHICHRFCKNGGKILATLFKVKFKFPSRIYFL